MSNYITIIVEWYEGGKQCFNLIHDNSQTDSSIATLDVIRKLIFLLNIGNNQKSFDPDVIDALIQQLSELKND